MRTTRTARASVVAPLLALLVVGPGCTTRFVANKADVHRADRAWQERGMESYIPGERMDGEPTFLRMSKLRAVEEIEGDPDRVVVLLKDPKPGLLYAGVPITILGVVLLALSANGIADSRDPLPVMGTIAFSVVVLGGASMIISGAVLRTPEGPRPSPGYGRSNRASGARPGLQLIGRF